MGTETLRRFPEQKGASAANQPETERSTNREGYNCPSVSHIVPMVVGASEDTIRKAEELQRKGFYALPVRPPTVPEGTSRIRFSLTADITEKEIDTLIEIING